MDVSANIASYLKKEGITKAHICKHSGIPKPRMTTITKGNAKGEMYLNEYISICDALHVAYSEFLK